MRDEYREVYSQLLSDRSALSRQDFSVLRTAPEAERFLANVRNRVERGIGGADIASKLRPDTEYALLICFEELIALPFFQGASPDRIEVTPEDFLQYVEDDTVQILKHAQDSKDRPVNISEEELTAGDIIRSISEIYDELQTVGVDVWG